MVKAVLVGCGAMSRAWLEAAARDRRPRRSSGWSTSIDGARRGARRRVRPRRRRDRHRPRRGARRAPARTWSSTSSFPPARRDVVADRASRHGCHVLTEKPLADSPRGRPGDRRRGARGRPHPRGDPEPPLPRRGRGASAASSPRARSARRPASTATSSSPPHFGGFREEMRPRAAARHGDPHLRRGALPDRRRSPTAVYCREWEPKGSWYQQGSSAAAIFEMAGGVVFTYRGSWCADGLRTSWESAWRIVGERGALTWDGFDGIRAEVRTGEPRRALRQGQRRSRCRRSTRATAIGGHLGRHRRISSPRSRTAPQPETARRPTTSRAWRWCSARSRAPRAGRRVAIEP